MIPNNPAERPEVKTAHKQIAKGWGLSYNTLVKVLVPTSPEGVSRKVVDKIAKGLGCAVDDLLHGLYYPDGIASFGLTKIAVHIRRQLDRATAFDLDRRYEEAVKICDRLISARLKPRDWSLVSVKKAIFLGDAGKQDQSKNILDEVIKNQRVDKLIRDWASYHHALASRRLWEVHREKSAYIEEARSVFKELRCHPHWAAAANHQLGAIYQAEGKFKMALKHLRAAQELWHGENNHREGFSCRRIGQICIAAKDHRSALRQLFDAACIFSRSGARRYAEDVEKEFEALLKLIWPA